MRIIEANHIQKTAASAKKKSANSADAGFGDLLETNPETNATAGAFSTGTVAIAGMLGLQDDLPDADQERIEHSDILLKQLDEIRLMLLDGQLAPHLAQQLSQQLNNQSDSFIPPALQEIVDEIELRAAVELAKLETH